MKKIVLVDGHNLLFRMFYGIPSSIKNSNGKEIKGLVGFIGSIKRITSELNPYSLVVVFDSQTSKNNNLNHDSNYKNNRIDYTDFPDNNNPFSQLFMIKKALDILKITYVEVENYEADDYISSIIYNNNGYQYIIFSTDSDFIQLINNYTFLYITRGKKSILYTEKYIIEKYNISPQQYVEYKSLIGDKSDNIKGINGIGKVNASKILSYGSINNYVINNPNSKLSKNLNDNMETILKNKKLISLCRELDTSQIMFNKLSKEILILKTYEIIEKIGEK